MTDTSKIDGLRRRIHEDPGSIAFAQLAEECRRAGRLQESIEVCQAGLARHPGYLSAHVTLGRSLLELGRLDEAEREFEIVRRGAPENLAALRSLAEIHETRGELPEAVALFTAALALARNDPDLQHKIADLTRRSSSVIPLIPLSAALRTVATLERLLEAIHVARTQPRA